MKDYPRCAAPYFHEHAMRGLLARVCRSPCFSLLPIHVSAFYGAGPAHTIEPSGFVITLAPRESFLVVRVERYGWETVTLVDGARSRTLHPSKARRGESVWRIVLEFLISRGLLPPDFEQGPAEPVKEAQHDRHS